MIQTALAERASITAVRSKTVMQPYPILISIFRAAISGLHVRNKRRRVFSKKPLVGGTELTIERGETRQRETKEKYKHRSHTGAKAGKDRHTKTYFAKALDSEIFGRKS
jgi:hypothetical protein